MKVSTLPTMVSIFWRSTEFSRSSAAFSVPSSLPETPASSSDSADTLDRNLSMPSAFAASASENFFAFSAVCVSGPRTSLGKSFEFGQHIVGAREDVLRRLQQVRHRRRVGGDFRDALVPLGLVEQIGLREVGALELDVRLSGQAGDADVGLRRLGDRRQPVDLGVGDGDGRVEHVDVDAPDVADLDAVEEHGAAAPQARSRAGDAHAQRRRLAAVADGGRPVDEGEGRDDRNQREDADDDVVCSGFHSALTLSRQDRAGAPACL